MSSYATKWFVGAVTVVSMAGVAGANTVSSLAAVRDASVTIAETGSSLMYPLFNGEWVSAYKSVAPNVSLTAASTGSGAGISQAIAGTVQIGASDAYMSDAQLKTSPTMLNIPMAISAQQIMYNIPGLSKKKHLNLAGDVLAQVYSGQIRYWDDAKIAKLNKGVSLPHQLIVPVRRSDGSGDTFLFTQFLSDTSAAWFNNVAYGTSVGWPAVDNEIGAKGNSGVVQALSDTKYSIGYVGISFLDQAVNQGLGYAALKNKAGRYLLPTAANIQAAASVIASSTPKDERISMIFAPGATSYPIINYEYAIVNSKQPSSSMSSQLKKFLSWSISPTGGNDKDILAEVHFLPLPSAIQSMSQNQIDQIGN